MAGETSFRNHMDMISLNEPVTRKAKFWQAYVRALKGTDDMRADDSIHKRPASRAFSEFPEFFGGSTGSGDPSARIYAPGYRYLPVSRETYGYSPRKLYGYENPSRYVPRAVSVPPPSASTSPLLPDKRMSELPDWLIDNPDHFYPTKYPLCNGKPWNSTDASTIYEPSKYEFPLGKKPYKDILNPSPNLPITSITRDPWWHDVGLKPIEHIPRDILLYPSSLRKSFLSPVKNSYLWTNHPLRYL